MLLVNDILNFTGTLDVLRGGARGKVLLRDAPSPPIVLRHVTRATGDVALITDLKMANMTNYKVIGGCPSLLLRAFAIDNGTSDDCDAATANLYVYMWPKPYTGVLGAKGILAVQVPVTFGLSKSATHPCTGAAASANWHEAQSFGTLVKNNIGAIAYDDGADVEAMLVIDPKSFDRIAVYTDTWTGLIDEVLVSVQV